MIWFPGKVNAKKRYQEYAHATVSKTRNINIRLSEKDIQKLKREQSTKAFPTKL